MPFPEASTNVEISIWRRAEDEYAGQREPGLVYSGIRAFFQEASMFNRQEGVGGASTREKIVAGVIVFDAYTNDGRVIDVRAGDEVRFEDYRGLEEQREITLVTPNFVRGEIDTLIVEVK